MLTENLDNVRSHTVEHFVSCYPSHDFVIDDEEAKKWFKHVELPSEELYRVIALLGKVAREESHETVVLALSPNDDDEAGGETDGEKDEIEPKDGDHEQSGQDYVPQNDASADAGRAPQVDDSGQSTSESDASQAG